MQFGCIDMGLNDRLILCNKNIAVDQSGEEDNKEEGGEASAGDPVGKGEQEDEDTVDHDVPEAHVSGLSLTFTSQQGS